MDKIKERMAEFTVEVTEEEKKFIEEHPYMGWSAMFEKKAWEIVADIKLLKELNKGVSESSNTKIAKWNRELRKVVQQRVRKYLKDPSKQFSR